MSAHSKADSTARMAGGGGVGGGIATTTVAGRPVIKGTVNSIMTTPTSNMNPTMTTTTTTTTTTTSTPSAPSSPHLMMPDAVMPLATLSTTAIPTSTSTSASRMPIGRRPRARSNVDELVEERTALASNITDDDDCCCETTLPADSYGSSVGSGTSTQTSPTSPFRPILDSGNGNILYELIASSSASAKRNSAGKLEWVYEYGAEKEFDRQTRLHYVVKQVFGGNLKARLKNPSKILECACGVGLWSLEMAQSFPNCQIIGMDIVPPNDKDAAHWINAVRANGGNEMTLSNLSYEYGDVLNPLKYDDNTFDLVYQRDASTIMPSKHWRGAINEFFRIVRPGGLVELVEHEMTFKYPGPNAQLIGEWFQMAGRMVGIEADYNEFIKDLLVEAGFVDIEVLVYDVPIGEWPQDPMERSQGFLNREQMRTIFKTMRRWWLSSINVTTQEYDRVCSATLEEFDEYKTCTSWKIFIAKKPL
ncbi:hypothetical protein EC973_007618 [Apophysomyces ossiformis]|uniref:Methyltransferase domain-containing protein n=1 Tax=Apophysomyces ossiformis TaxID=679940 RepID=A0A8H7BPG7_9FUNG|nr:hypothetical protein EC973_007618 [Apophysomyces ossiformis]